MSYPAYDPDRDTLAALAGHMLGTAAIVSFLISEFSGGDFSELAPLDQNAVHNNVHMAICDSLTELGARHAAIDIATAATILHDALKAIAESIFPEDEGFLCERRGHVGRYRPRRR